MKGEDLADLKKYISINCLKHLHKGYKCVIKSLISCVTTLMKLRNVAYGSPLTPFKDVPMFYVRCFDKFVMEINV